MFFPDFLPQAAHVDGESVVIYIISTAVPQSAQKDIPGHHALLVQQGQQQPKLRGGQGQGGPVPGDAHAAPVDFQGPCPEGQLPVPPQQYPDAA